MSGNTRFPSSWTQYSIRDVGGGLNVDTATVEANELLSAINVDLDKKGSLSKRQGTVKANASPLVMDGPLMGAYYYKSRDDDGILGGKIILTDSGNVYSANADPGNRLSITGFSTLGSGLTISVTSFCTLGNKAIISSKDCSLYTDGTGVYANGVAAPATTVSTVSVSGSLTTGSYLVAVTYVRGGDFEYETNRSAPETVAVTGPNGSIDVGIVASDDPQIDKINIYCSGNGGTELHYQGQVDNDDDTYTITSVALTGVLPPEDNNVPPNARFVVSKANRVFYINTDEVGIGPSQIVWSHEDDPHSVGNANTRTFDAEDGDEITAVGEMLNYIVLFKRNKMRLIDAYEFTFVDVSHNDGCAAPGSVRTVLDGKAVVFYSDEGIKVFDGNQVLSLTKNKVNNLAIRGVDKNNVNKSTVSYYSPETRRYGTAIPTTDGYVWLVMHFDAGGWTRYVLDMPVAFINAESEEGNIVPVYASQSGNNVTLYRMEPGLYSDNGSDIRMEVQTVKHDMGLPGVSKQVRRCYMSWQGNGAELNFEVMCDYGSGSGFSRVVKSEPATYFGYAYFGSAYFGATGMSTETIHLRGKAQAYNFGITEESDIPVTVYDMNFLFYPVSYQGVPDAQ